jgi:pyruvate formate-lyase activating enzyme-like uncharacterized protein
MLTNSCQYCPDSDTRKGHDKKENLWTNFLNERKFFNKILAN